ncbi:MAG: ACP S-malonyltransferase, partial [Deltaproteobacteria bacterium]
LEEALRIVRRRGELMHESGVARPGAMAAILGDVSRPIEEICAEATRDAGTVVPANYNSPGQLVLSGEISGVERAMTLCKEAGAKRAVRLNVSGAFHSPLMETASRGLAQALDSARFMDPRFTVYANVDGSPVTDASRAKSLLLRQLSSPVRWTDEVLAMTSRYPEALYIEMGPGSVLAGLVKKIAPTVKTMTCGTAAEVSELAELATA